MDLKDVGDDSGLVCHAVSIDASKADVAAMDGVLSKIDSVPNGLVISSDAGLATLAAFINDDGAGLDRISELRDESGCDRRSRGHRSAGGERPSLGRLHSQSVRVALHAAGRSADYIPGMIAGIGGAQIVNISASTTIDQWVCDTFSCCAERLGAREPVALARARGYSLRSAWRES